MPRPVHFEISAADPERAASFYEAVFGWTVKRWDGPAPYWLLTTGPDGEMGINGGMMQRDEGRHMPNCNTIAVPSIDEYIVKVEAAGGKVMAPKMEIPTIGYLAYLVDTEENWFGLIEPFPRG